MSVYKCVVRKPRHLQTNPLSLWPPRLRTVSIVSLTLDPIFPVSSPMEEDFPDSSRTNPYPSEPPPPSATGPTKMRPRTPPPAAKHLPSVVKKRRQLAVVPSTHPMEKPLPAEDVMEILTPPQSVTPLVSTQPESQQLNQTSRVTPPFPRNSPLGTPTSQSPPIKSPNAFIGLDSTSMPKFPIKDGAVDHLGSPSMEVSATESMGSHTSMRWQVEDSLLLHHSARRLGMSVADEDALLEDRYPHTDCLSLSEPVEKELTMLPELTRVRGLPLSAESSPSPLAGGNLSSASNRTAVYSASTSDTEQWPGSRLKPPSRLEPFPTPMREFTFPVTPPSAPAATFVREKHCESAVPASVTGVALPNTPSALPSIGEARQTTPEKTTASEESEEKLVSSPVWPSPVSPRLGVYRSPTFSALNSIGSSSPSPTQPFPVFGVSSPCTGNAPSPRYSDNKAKRRKTKAPRVVRSDSPFVEPIPFVIPEHTSPRVSMVSFGTDFPIIHQDSDNASVAALLSDRTPTSFCSIPREATANFMAKAASPKPRRNRKLPVPPSEGVESSNNSFQPLADAAN